MTPLTNEDFATVQRFVQLMSEKVAAIGLDVFVETNFNDYNKLRRELSPDTVQNPTFDPEHSNVSFHNAFWLRAVETNGDTVAMVAQRVLDTENFLEDLKKLRLWHDRPATPPGVLNVDGCEFARTMSGRVGHAGGLWIDPSFRKKNLSGILDHLGRGLLLKNFWFDYITGIISPELAATGIWAKQYGWESVDGKLSFDFFHPGGPMVAFGFCHMSRAKSLERMAQWLLVPEADSVEQLDQVGKLLVD